MRGNSPWNLAVLFKTLNCYTSFNLDEFIKSRHSRVGGTGTPAKRLAGCGKTPIDRHSRESGSPEYIEKTGFLLPQEWHPKTENDFFSNLLDSWCPLREDRFHGNDRKTNLRTFYDSINLYRVGKWLRKNFQTHFLSGMGLFYFLIAWQLERRWCPVRWRRGGVTFLNFPIK